MLFLLGWLVGYWLSVVYQMIMTDLASYIHRTKMRPTELNQEPKHV